MENILKIIFDKSKKNSIIDLNDMEKIIDLLILNNKLNSYISNIKIQQIRSNKLASYSSSNKEITIYYNIVDYLFINIDNSININDNFEILLYKNLMLLQIILHEVEHANQEKIITCDNTLEAYILRLSRMVDYNSNLYEYDAHERLAEIKSYENILLITNYIKDEFKQINSILNVNKSSKLLRGYHYDGENITYPISTFFKLSNRYDLLKTFDWYCDDKNEEIKKAINNNTLNDRLKYGFPILKEEYIDSMSNIIEQTNNNFNNKIIVI